MQQLFGTPGSNSDFGHLLTALGASIESLATTPENATGKHDVVSHAIQMTDRMNALSHEIQAMRREIDQNIAGTIAAINTKLSTIHDRSEERRVGKECVSTCRSRWAPYQSK